MSERKFSFRLRLVVSAKAIVEEMKPHVVDCFLLMGSVLSLRGDQTFPEIDVLLRREIVSTGINVSVTLLGLNLKNTQTMEVDIEFLLHQKWTDRRLAADEGTQRLAANGQVWSPKLTAVEGTVLIDDDAQFWRGTSPDGHVLLSVKIALSTRCTTDFARMPFDTQYCYVKVGSYRFPDGEIQAAWDTDPWENRMSERVRPFRVENIDAYNETDRRPSGNFTVLVARIALRRDTSRFLFCTFTPCNLFAVVSYFTFWLHPRLVGFRLAAAGLSLFGSVYSFAQSFCPYGSGSKPLDVFVLIGMAFVVAALTENVIVDHLWRKEIDVDLKIKLDYFAMVLYPLLFISANLTYIVVLTT